MWISGTTTAQQRVLNELVHHTTHLPLCLGPYNPPLPGHFHSGGFLATLNPIGAQTQRERDTRDVISLATVFVSFFSLFSFLLLLLFSYDYILGQPVEVCVCVCMVLVLKERNKTPKPNRARGRMDKDGRDTKRWKPGLQGGKRFHMYFGCEPGAKSVDCPFFFFWLVCLFFNTFHALRGEQTGLAFFLFLLRVELLWELCWKHRSAHALGWERITKQAWRIGGIFRLQGLVSK